jgi:hypothetical protein
VSCCLGHCHSSYPSSCAPSYYKNPVSCTGSHVCGGSCFLRSVFILDFSRWPPNCSGSPPALSSELHLLHTNRHLDIVLSRDLFHPSSWKCVWVSMVRAWSLNNQRLGLRKCSWDSTVNVSYCRRVVLISLLLGKTDVRAQAQTVGPTQGPIAFLPSMQWATYKGRGQRVQGGIIQPTVKTLLKVSKAWQSPHFNYMTRWWSHPFLLTTCPLHPFTSSS